MVHKDDQTILARQGLSPEGELFNKQFNFRAFPDVTHSHFTAVLLNSFLDVEVMLIQISNNG